MFKLVEKVLATCLLSVFVCGGASAQDDLSAVRDIKNHEVNVRQLEEAIASRTLTWLTGSSSNNDYISVGRTANYFGFVGLRVASGQSLSRNKVANDTLAILNPDQRLVFIELLEEQKVAFEQTRAARFKINRALEGMLIGETLSRDSFLALGRDYGSKEAELGRVIGQKLGRVFQTLTPAQKTALSEIRLLHISGQGHSIDRDGLKLKLAAEDKKELVNIAARFLSWTTGSATYNDFEVVGKPSQHFGFVSLRIDSSHGVRRGDVAKEVLAILTPAQRAILSAAAAHDFKVFSTFIGARGQLMRSLEVALAGETINAAKILRLGASVGELEATMTWSQAMAMMQIRKTMTDKQSTDLLAMRSKYTAMQGDLPDNPVDRGRQLFAQCVLCHDSALAPALTGVVGRKIAADKSFDGYSSALKSYSQINDVWSEAVLSRFLASPRAVVPGTFMRFDGFENLKDRQAVIAFLKTIDG